MLLVLDVLLIVFYYLFLRVFSVYLLLYSMYVTMSISIGLYPNLDLWNANKLHHITLLGTWWIVPVISNLNARWLSALIHILATLLPTIHWIVGWVSPRASLGILVKIKISLTPPGIIPQFLSLPAHNLLTTPITQFQLPHI